MTIPNFGDVTGGSSSTAAPIDPAALIKATRAVIAAQHQYPDLTTGEADQIVKSHTNGRFNADDAQKMIERMSGDHGNAVAGALQGFTGNFGDEAVGMLPKALGGGEAGKEEMRLRGDILKRDHPVGNAVAQLGGGLTAGVLTGGLAPELQVGGRVASAAANSAIAGGAFGAVSGAGEGENMADRLKGAAVGGVGGSLLGGALGSAGARVAATLKPTVPGRVADVIDKAGGVSKLKGLLDGWDKAGLGSEVVAGDLTPTAQMATRGAMNSNPDVWTKGAGLFNDRQSNMTERLLNKSTSLVGSHDANSIQEGLAKSRIDWAKEAYDGMRGSDATFKPSDVGQYMKKPEIRSALATARTAGDLLDESPMSTILQRLQDGSASAEDKAALVRAAQEGTTLPTQPSAPRRPIDFTDMHALHRALDGKVGSAYKNGNVPLAEAYKTIRGAVGDAIESKVPEFGKINAEYSGRLKLESMLQKGVDAWHLDDPGLVHEFNAMTPESQDVLRRGLASELQGTLRTTGTNANTGARIVNGPKSMKEKLGIIFGDKLDTYLDAAAREKTMAQTKSAASGGSSTALNQVNADFNPLSHVPSVLHGNLLNTALRVLTGNQAQKWTAAQAAKTGDAMLTQGSPAIRGLMDDYAARMAKPLLGRRTTGLLGVGGASGLNAARGLFF